MDEERDDLNQTEAASAGQMRVEWRDDGVGDGKGEMTINGEPAGREPLPPNMPPQSPASSPADPDETEALRQENAELKAQFEQAQPFIAMNGNPAMKQMLDEYISRGEVEAPRGPAHTLEDSAGFQLRASEPEFEAVREVMRLHASTLPEYEAQILDSNPAAFNRAYDKIKATLGDKVKAIRPHPPALPAAYSNVPMDRRTLETAIRAKEVSRARVEPPGIAPQEQDADPANRDWSKEGQRLLNARNNGEKYVVYKGQRMEMDHALVMHRTTPPERTPQGGTNW